MHIFSSFFFLYFSAAPYSSAPTPLPCRHGEGQDDIARARKEDEGGGEGQEAATWIVVARGAVAELDPGRLDPVFDSAGGSGRAGGVWAYRQGSGKVAGVGDESPALTG